MAVQIHKQFFSDLAGALEDIGKHGFWPTTYVSDASPAVPTHWHDCDVHGYLLEGQSWVLDGESGERLDVVAGDKLVIPAGCLHAEGENTERVVYLVALPEPRPFHTFLKTYAPDDPARPGASGDPDGGPA